MSDRPVFLVTGATGVVGSAIVPLLLAASDARVYLLLRAASDEALASRLHRLFDFWGAAVAPAAARRLFAMRGDVARSRLGLSDSDYETVRRTVTNIIHSAGSVKLNQTLAAARASAVSSAEEMIRLARACGSLRRLPKLEYLSTVGVAGRRPGIVAEEQLDDRFGYHNTYEQAKAEAERMVLREAAAGLAVTVHRPSMVVGDSGDGHVLHFQVFYHLVRFLAGSRTRGILPQFGEATLDLVPADYVAKAIVLCSRREDASGRILHLCSGPAGAIPLGRLSAMLRDFLAGHGERVFRPRHVRRRLLDVFIRIGSALAPPTARRSLSTLPYFMTYLDNAQQFANGRTVDLLATGGVELPAVEQYLNRVLEYWYTRT